MKGNCFECSLRWTCEIDPDYCNEWPDPVPMSNADRIRSMTDEELSVFLCEHFKCYSNSCPGIGLCKTKEGKANGLLKWLQKQVKEAYE